MRAFGWWLRGACCPTLWLLFAAAFLAPTPLLANAPHSIEHLSGIHERIDLQGKQLLPINVTGVVLGVDPVHRTVFLQDKSGVAWLELPSLSPDLKPGAQIRVEGNALIGDGAAVLGWRPVIDQQHNVRDGIGTCTVYLAAGRHPFKLVYHQLNGPSQLSVQLTTPGGVFTNLPASMLQHLDSTTGGWRAGVAYEAVSTAAGAPQSIASGTATELDLKLSPDGTNFSLVFTGAIEVLEPGEHVFELRADDSVRLELQYDGDARVELLGRGELPTPVRMVPGQLWAERPQPIWSEVDGVVKHAGMFEGRLHLEVAAETGRMQVLVSAGDPSVAQFLLNCRIRVAGLARSVATPAGSRMAGRLLSPGMGYITILQAPEALWTRIPFFTIDRLAALPLEPRPLVRIRGVVSDVIAGSSLTLSDGQGHVEALTRKARVEDKGTTIEVLGRLGPSNRLENVAYRNEAQPEHREHGLPTLTTIEQIRRLKPDEVTQSYPLKFQGVVTFVFPGGLRGHVQGDSEGIYVSCVNNNPQPLRVGDLCDFEGYSSRGAFSPVVTYRKRTVLGRGHIPEPARPDWSRLMNGSLDSQWIELQGVVLRVEGPELTIGVRGGEVPARVFELGGQDLKPLVSSVVRMRGTIRAFSGPQRQLQRIQLQVTSPAQISIDDAAPADPFNTPMRTIAELFQFDANAASLYRVRTHGQVVHVRDAVGYLMDGTNGMRFVARAGQKFTAGDRVEVVGFPETEGFAPVMRQGRVKVVGRAPLPRSQALAAEDLLNRVHDSTLVQVDATVLNIRTNQSDYLLELQADSHTFTARLDSRLGLLPLVPAGSHVRISGLYSALTSHQSNSVQPFELLLNSPADLVVLSRPSWWTLRHTLLVLAAMTLVLALSVMWITALRRRVETRTRELRDEIEVRKRAEADLQRSAADLQREIEERIQLHAALGEQKSRLEVEIEERKRMEVEVEAIHRQLMDASRQAGQAEVASSVLHNVGNVLNSVNVSSGLLLSRLQEWQLGTIDKAAGLVEKRVAVLARELPADDPMRKLPDYLSKLAAHLEKQRDELVAEVKDLAQNVEHIKEIVAMQQTYARVSGVLEKVDPRDLVESAVKMHAGALARHNVTLLREFKDVPAVVVDRHKVLQILVNLLHNAKYACDEGNAPQKTITVRIEPEDKNRILIQVADNGIGIPPENMKRLFSHGFTTRKTGHGFGLHSAALAARELGGRINVASDGPGKGATFTLEMPLEPDRGAR